TSRGREVRITGDLAQTVVDDGSQVSALLEVNAAQAAAALRAGKAVVTNQVYLQNGTVQVAIANAGRSAVPTGKAGRSPVLRSIPAVAVTGGIAHIGLILPPVLARSLHVVATPIGVLATL